MKTQKAERAADLPTLARDSHDDTRAHALNWALGVASLTLSVLAGLGLIAFALLDLHISRELILLILLAPLSGIAIGALKLIQFTAEHRDYLYRLEDAYNVDLNMDGEIGQPAGGETPTGTFVMGPNGVRHRLDTELTGEEIKAVKRILLGSGKATVRALTGTVGDRASQLRQELIRIGVCEEPAHKRAAAELSEAGRKAVRRW